MFPPQRCVTVTVLMLNTRLHSMNAALRALHMRALCIENFFCSSGLEGTNAALYSLDVDDAL